MTLGHEQHDAVLTPIAANKGNTTTSHPHQQETVCVVVFRLTKTPFTVVTCPNSTTPTGGPGPGPSRTHTTSCDPLLPVCVSYLRTEKADVWKLHPDARKFSASFPDVSSFILSLSRKQDDGGGRDQRQHR